ncbi:hypothetical protein [Mycobacterium sp. CnD-18-1]|uniref:hypothetical protein n=1 Tax=Mycobacterium sp. CnD-18-1 TaxID=2917744 RepID=UPI001EF22D1A|nr:hypothetical protein [Mycobacterium sp. CnD-18-1]MCG7607114.1 hypothetical protein [Mycobacterium sp. CnD-18-1]
MMFNDQIKLTAMPMFDLHQTERELMAQLRHPASYGQPNLRTQMGERLADVRAEFERRWESFTKEQS